MVHLSAHNVLLYAAAFDSFILGLQNRDPSNRLTFDLFTYHKLEEIDTYLAAIQSSAADLAVDFSLRSVATTHEGRPIKLVSISSKDKRYFYQNFISVSNPLDGFYIHPLFYDWQNLYKLFVLKGGT